MDRIHHIERTELPHAGKCEACEEHTICNFFDREMGGLICGKCREWVWVVEIHLAAWVLNPAPPMMMHVNALRRDGLPWNAAMRQRTKLCDGEEEPSK